MIVLQFFAFAALFPPSYYVKICVEQVVFARFAAVVAEEAEREAIVTAVRDVPLIPYECLPYYLPSPFLCNYICLFT
jgi:hypothetical protein